MNDKSAYRNSHVVLALSTIVFVLNIALYGSDLAFSGDSMSYLYAYANRPIGYPIFLDIIRLISPTLTVLVFVQGAILAASIAGLMVVAIRTTDDRGGAGPGLSMPQIAVTAGLAVLAGCHPYLARLGKQILSEALSASLICVFAATMLVFARRVQRDGDGAAGVGRATMACGLAASLVAAAAVLVRPVNLSLFAANLLVVAVLPGLLRRERWRYAGFLVACLGLAWFASPIAHYALTGRWTQSSPLARGLFQKAVFVDHVDAAAYARCIGIREWGASETLKRYHDAAPPDYRRALRSKIGDYVRFKVVIPMVQQREGYPDRIGVDRNMMCYARQAWREHPLWLASDILREFWFFATATPFSRHMDQKGFNAYVAAHPVPVPQMSYSTAQNTALADRYGREFPASVSRSDRSAIDYGAIFQLKDTITSGGIIWLFGILFSILFAVLNVAPAAAAAIAIMWSRRRPSALQTIILANSVFCLGGLAITSVTEFYDSRYCFVYWPVMLANGWLCLVMLENRGARRERRADPAMA